MGSRKPTFLVKFPKSEKFAQSRILHSLKTSGAPGARILKVLGVVTTKINIFRFKMILRRVFGQENCRKDKKYVIFS